MKRLLAATSIALAMIASPVISSDIGDIASSTYLLKRNGIGICSGTFVRSNDTEDLLLTAAHCVTNPSLDGKDSIFSVSTMAFDENMDITSKVDTYLDVARVNAETDTAILRVRAPKEASFTVVDVATNDEASLLKVGAPIIASGFPLGDFYSITEGYFLGKSRVDLEPLRDNVFYRTSASITQGSSGGGLYANFEGEWKVIGSATAVDPRIDFRSMFSTSESTNAIIAAPDDVVDVVGDIDVVLDMLNGVKK